MHVCMSFVRVFYFKISALALLLLTAFNFFAGAISVNDNTRCKFMDASLLSALVGLKRV